MYRDDHSKAASVMVASVAIYLGLLKIAPSGAEVEGSQVRLSANADVAVTMEQEAQVRFFRYRGSFAKLSGVMPRGCSGHCS